MNPIFVALDMPDAGAARAMADAVRGYVGGLKIGLTCYHANPTLVTHIVTGFDWFLDLKWYDIPTQVAGAIRSVMPTVPFCMSIHEAGGTAMMQAASVAAQAEAQRLAIPRPKVLAVTTLTSLPASLTTVVAQTHHAMTCGLDGVILPPHMLRTVRSEMGIKPFLVTPGIRMADTPADDHVQPVTPRQAIDDGANLLVIGRPITQAADPREAARMLAHSLG